MRRACRLAPGALSGHGVRQGENLLLQFVHLYLQANIFGLSLAAQPFLLRELPPELIMPACVAHRDFGDEQDPNISSGGLCIALGALFVQLDPSLNAALPKQVTALEDTYAMVTARPPTLQTNRAVLARLSTGLHCTFCSPPSQLW
eukprot:CAMPEP_0118989204 /NCGR_PEP_ID=MMETSP1173-20130426/47549_1 /TAXON_ID=1034831 /ORGANISM="Rhizochromulina marina cf, Strain CCMP1243" /LENGTH=145 /DNA_ID=CAMNT_0006940179 /DNA_START=1314 /DNA_END=1748 /DNA_ORIENTATION=+